MKSSTQKRHIYIVANWKSNPITMRDLEKLQKGYLSLSPAKSTSIVVCPSPLHQLLDFAKPIQVGAQDVSLRNGTGFWNTEMLKQCGVTYCIVGHSERRNVGESDSDVRNKATQLIESGIIPIVCVGESIRDDNGKYINVIKHQLKILCEGLGLAQVGRMIIAYEPLWAIGAGAMRPCTPPECYEVLHIIREEIARLVPGIKPSDVVVLYGGSVDARNAAAYVDLGSADGLLIGRASLDVVQIQSIVASVEQL
jgi:triosephosphate isomerase (TIM)